MVWDWLNERAGALSALAALATLVFTGVLVLVTRRQAHVAQRQADIAEKQVALQQEMHRKEGPMLLLHFAGFQSQPIDPRNEMLWLMVGIGNEGRRDVRVTLLEIEVLDPKKDGYHTHALFPRHKIGHGTNSRGHYEPAFPSAYADSLFGHDAEPSRVSEAGAVIKSHDAESFYVALPANGGWHEWRKVRLRVSGIGVEPATKDVEWDLWWLERKGAK